MPEKIYVNKRIPFILFIFITTSFAAFSQTPKGLILDDKEAIVQGNTRALIVGISKYEYVDSLQYADRDAKMFAEYLWQNSFWSIKKEDITLLLNDKARYGDLTVQLQRIALVSKPGDNLLFYFSGHGDVETQTIFNRGYLLAYDTYSSNYMANGLRVDDLKDLFVTLLSNNIKVIIVTDACRSGKLAGGLKGAEFTAAAISNMWKNEIKILSSQPGQLSYEDKKWGNGRGVFSYYLINGLHGEADTNKDSTITLSELEVYVGSNVARETGNKQQPIFEGPNKYSSIIGKILPQTASRNNKQGGNSAKNRKIQSVLPDDSCSFYYKKMDAAIKGKKLRSGDMNSAVFFYKKLKLCDQETDLLLRANSELLSALMNTSQEIINNSFIGRKLVRETDFHLGIELLQEFIENNDLQMLHVKHIKNLIRYLKVLNIATWHEDINTNELTLLLDSAIKEEPDAAYLLTAKAAVEMKKKNWTVAIQILESSLVKSPGWLIPQYYLGICYANKKNYKKALEYYEQVLNKDKNYQTFECTKCILQNMAEYALRLKMKEKAWEYLNKSIELFPDYYPPYEILYDFLLEDKNTDRATQYINQLKKYDDSVSIRLIRLRFVKDFFATPLTPASLDSVKLILKTNFDSADYYYTVGLFYQDHEDDIFSAIEFYNKAIILDSTESFYMLELIKTLKKEDDNDEIQRLLIKHINNYIDDGKAELQFELVESYIQTDSLSNAFEICKELKETGYYLCRDLKKYKKVFDKLPEYQQYIKNCTDVIKEK